MFTYLPLARHDWETASTYSFPSVIHPPPVPRLTRYQRRQCILSQREYVLNHINGDLGLLEYPIRIVVSDRPHLVYEASLEDLIEPTKMINLSRDDPKTTDISREFKTRWLIIW